MGKDHFLNHFYLPLLIGSMIMMVGCGDPIIEIEEANTYHWQKNMNEVEFEKLKNDMSYIEVVETAGGAGKKVKNNEYRWNDETLLTQAYIVKFKDDKLIAKEIIAVKGHSNR
ncbi:hypothetical protein MKX57_21490 [Lysinibacillus sp. FSL M8-0216]|uniref:Uncharacterized protein n=1 Tax=Lysinibacillus fusiformis TaxID=28031 RepID=A0A1H9QUA8_9BACI|nr:MULTISPECIES: hypothetical protein [Lysinibacillus]MCG7437753.1 hypothetical protein [Lysinibacillus fusiformis]MED4076977.1 hypothetical protein [Lysinibacillus fusiformis]MED4672229.1 hypothetical protein [Lysinibacillus fusiformis]PCD81249.1 hypothetical protein CNQ87_22140 [Lysinibacillus fusiformis]QAS57623.1 hypothetical protein LSP_15415 [Lysinibacillus sphaericus]